MRTTVFSSLPLSLLLGLSVAPMQTVRATTIDSNSVFATGAAVGATAPDSITVGNGSVWVTYTNGADSTGAGGSSTVVQYGVNGQVMKTYTIAGSVDGLKINPNDGKVWAMQNQDGNSTLSIINPTTGTVGPALQYAVKSSTQGYDDVVFTGGHTFLSYTNPTASTDPTIQLLQSLNSPLAVSPVLTMGAIGINLATGTMGPTTQNDPDSLKLTPNGSLMLSSGGDGQLIFVNNPDMVNQSVSFLQLLNPATGGAVSGLDDAVYATAASGTFYLADTNNNRVLAIHASNLPINSLYASVGSLNELASVNQGTGDANSLVAGLNGPHGLQFVADTPEPASGLLVFAGLALAVKQRRKAPQPSTGL